MSGDQGGDCDFSGVKVFIVEDESLISMLLEDILDDLGCGLAASAASLRDAMEKAATVTAHIAILDINLAGDPIFPVAERLAERGIPIVFASGYGASTLPEAWRNRPTLPKPFTSRQVEEALAAALQSNAA